MLTHKKYRISAAAMGAFALGSFALGAFAVGALAIGRLAIGRLYLRSGSLGSLHVGDLSVDRLKVSELLGAERSQLASAEAQSKDVLRAKESKSVQGPSAAQDSRGWLPHADLPHSDILAKCKSKPVLGRSEVSSNTLNPSPETSVCR
jgi:hypothetical protein